ncbi:MAG: metallophosphoesterase [Candidatus Izemoplasmatales bacterium]
MNILIFSDTHGDLQAYQEMLSYEQNIDKIYCLGDSGFSLEFLEEKNITSVRGNYPFGPKVPYDIIENIGGFSLFFTHGHRYFVKFGLSNLKEKAKILKMDLALYGHTHKAKLIQENQLILLNPGALSYSRSHLFPSYAKIILEDHKVDIYLINLKTQEVFQELHEVKHE